MSTVFSRVLVLQLAWFDFSFRIHIDNYISQHFIQNRLYSSANLELGSLRSFLFHHLVYRVHKPELSESRKSKTKQGLDFYPSFCLFNRLAINPWHGTFEALAVLLMISQSQKECQDRTPPLPRGFSLRVAVSQRKP